MKKAIRDWLRRLGLYGKTLDDLERHPNGNVKCNSRNINIILTKDKNLKGVFGADENETKYLLKNASWLPQKVKKPTAVKPIDFAALRQYLDINYGIDCLRKVKDALGIVSNFNRFKPEPEPDEDDEPKERRCRNC